MSLTPRILAQIQPPPSPLLEGTLSYHVESRRHWDHCCAELFATEPWPGKSCSTQRKLLSAPAMRRNELQLYVSLSGGPLGSSSAYAHRRAG